jgi:transcriptional regulator with XRE-family HTH domain
MGMDGIVARYPPNPRLRQARLHAGLSQDELAERLGTFMRDQQQCNVSPSGNLIGMWERGEVRPSRHYRRGLAELTGLTEPDLGFGPALPFPDSTPALVEEDDTNRREMISSMMAAGVALSGFPLPPRAGVPDRVGPQHVAELRRLTQMYRTWVYQHGADRELRHGLARLLDRATTLTSQASAPRLRRDLLDATADSAGLAAYACRDLGQHEWAQQYYLIAMQAAHAAGDHALAGHLVVRMAGHNIELAQPAEVLAYLEAARRASSRARFTHGDLSNQHAIAAWANAQTGNAPQVHRHTGLAEEQFASARQHTGPDWQVRHIAEAELYSLTGAGYTELARHEPRHATEAIRRLNLALELRGADGARNATLDTISLAEAHLADHDLSQALDATRRAVGLAEDSASRRVRKRLDELGRRLHPHRRATGAADVLDQIGTLERDSSLHKADASEKAGPS